jgi:pimeloyl-ACP methyl ester carboxylesterase
MVNKALLLYQFVAATAEALLTSNTSYGPFNLNASFGSSPTPMIIDVDPRFIAETRLKASLTRNPIDIYLLPFTEGIPSHNLTAIREYWVNQYNWSVVQDNLNADFNHFTTTVGPLPSTYNYTRPVPLHFVHHRSTRSNAIPLLFIHGWPGSFLEVAKILEPLTQPPPEVPAFHVVAPSIPGFGFSPAPTGPGFGLIEAGAAFNDLMGQLGYDHFVVQGGDLGSHTARYMAAMFPESVVSILSNLYNVNPSATDLARQAQGETTAEENAYIDFIEQSEPFYNAFWGIQETVPLQVAILLGDSPVGNIAWTYLGMRSFSPGYFWEIEELITWGMMLYIQGPYGSVRIYAELDRVSNKFECY